MPHQVLCHDVHNHIPLDLVGGLEHHALQHVLYHWESSNHSQTVSHKHVILQYGHLGVKARPETIRVGDNISFVVTYLKMKL